MATPEEGPRVLGIDDWAWRKGHRYETILCDLERGKVIDLLPERSEESTEAWMRYHPGTEIVSRDRTSLYAEAATKAAPQAVQVADLYELEVIEHQERLQLKWQMRRERSIWQQSREGAYLLRSNLPATDLEQLWKSYIQLTEAEAPSAP